MVNGQSEYVSPMVQVSEELKEMAAQEERQHKEIMAKLAPLDGMLESCEKIEAIVEAWRLTHRGR